jgi:flagellar hook protein FlgE
MSIPLSSLQSAQTRLNITANNIANINTTNFQQKTPAISELPTGGVTISDITPSSSIDSTNPNNVDLATQMINMKEESIYYSANAQVLKTMQQTLGSILNIFA